MSEALTVRSDLSNRVREVENVFIPLADGLRLAARLFLPIDATPAPTILEYIPYRKRDFTRSRDEGVHRYVAAHGYAVMRVDVRGSGDSDATNRAFGEEVRGLAAEIGLEPIWTGFVSPEEIGPYFGAVDMMALPFDDGASLRRGSLQAALGYGRPTLTTFPVEEDIPELVNGENVTYVPVGDEQALAHEMVLLARDPERCSTLALGAGEAARQFTWESIAERTLAFYEKTIAMKGH